MWCGSSLTTSLTSQTHKARSQLTIVRMERKVSGGQPYSLAHLIKWPLGTVVISHLFLYRVDVFKGLCQILAQVHLHLLIRAIAEGSLTSFSKVIKGGC